MRHRSQEKLRGLCLSLLVFGALGCGDDPAAPAGQTGPAGQTAATLVPGWAEQICQYWRRRDGSCDQTALVADYEDCMRTKGVPEFERLSKAGVRTRMRFRGQERVMNLCLEQRSWVITEAGRAHQLGKPRKAAPPS